MPTFPSSIISESVTSTEAEKYDRWFRAKVNAALNETLAGIAHNDVMAEMDTIIVEIEQKREFDKNNRR